MNTGHVWTPDEMRDAAMLDWEEFSAKYPELSIHAYRHKKREVTPKVDVQPVKKISVPRADGCVNFNIGFYDIETSFSRHRRLMTCAVVDGHGDHQLVDYYTHPGEGWWDDKNLLAGTIEMLRPFNILVGWNSKRFDIRTINGRAAVHGLMPLRPQIHLDLMYVFKTHMDLGGSSLENIGEVFDSAYHKIKMTPMQHQRAEAGDLAMYDRLRDHNVADVMLTRDVFVHALPYITTLNKSPLF